METPLSPRQASRIFSLLLVALIVGFVIAALLTAYLTFTVTRDLVTSWQITNLPGISLNGATPTPNPSGVLTDPNVPLQMVGPTPEPWDGASRISVLVMGLDYRDWVAGEGAPRTDTMILFTLDPLSKTAGVLNIPRDLWVAIPGFGYGKINTAYQLGEAYKLPGGGPELAMKTVEGLLGVPIQFYAQIDFRAFIRFVDEIGGVKVDIKEPIKVDLLGDNTFKKLKPGRQTLNGEIALAYARARSTEGGDFDRARRQQEVIMGIREQMLRLDNLPRTIAKAPVLYQELSSGIRTNLSLDQAIRLAWFAKDIPEENIKHAIIGPEQVNFFKTSDGLDALKPMPDRIRELRDQIFADTRLESPLANLPSVEQMKAEGARVRVLNGSAVPGLASQTMDYLQKQGVNVVETGNADTFYNYTALFDYSGKPYTLKFLVELMGINPNYLYNRYDPTQNVDVVVILGNDWANKIPVP
ncbi:MAG: LCP family protein [Anaerolineales bacterium]|nr:LCP family protein [Anaerolineales bacterium]MCS7247599.1 LCP family protein [Anaerolineales bacterium]MDW8161410.1 LCP family protein [Anaerolineales bacterium]MDW8446663.1 LCP family protein [Anaerolineales bacterium]